MSLFCRFFWCLQAFGFTAYVLVVIFVFVNLCKFTGHSTSPKIVTHYQKPSELERRFYVPSAGFYLFFIHKFWSVSASWHSGCAAANGWSKHSKTHCRLMHICGYCLVSHSEQLIHPEHQDPVMCWRRCCSFSHLFCIWLSGGFYPSVLFLVYLIILWNPSKFKKISVGYDI